MAKEIIRIPMVGTLMDDRRGEGHCVVMGTRYKYSAHDGVIDRQKTDEALEEAAKALVHMLRAKSSGAFFSKFVEVMNERKYSYPDEFDKHLIYKEEK